jgi:D-alanyl-lipoteichoic acid acyltransferase DltB (MBOAT superfamily)
MLFNSFIFPVFLILVFTLYWFVFNKSLKLQNIIILGASYFFYGWWSVGFLGLLFLSTFLDYAYGFGVASTNKTKARLFLYLSVINNLGILGVFKYYNFFALQFKTGFQSLGFHIDPVLIDVALPIGISFYTFHGMSYVFDIYKERQKPVSNFIDYAVFVSFFPLLVAGPIERANHLLPQVQRRRTFNYEQAADGCRLMLWGLFKKVVLADNLAKIVDNIYGRHGTVNGFTLAMGAIAFSFQIYGDFSGYSDIALGTAKLFGFELLSNFKFPYFSRDIAEFWRRWHISLSSWFRDYLYFPLGGSREGKAKAVRNTFIIFLVSGFWHGASWNFIIWGFIHACGFLPLLLLNRNRTHVTNVVAENRKLPSGRELLQMLGTFAFVTLAWVFFRAPDLQVATSYLSRMFSTIFIHPRNFIYIDKGIMAFTGKEIFIYIVPLLLIDWWLRRDERSLRKIKLKPVFRSIIYLVMLQLCFSNMIEQKAKNKSQTFIYFQF